MAAAKAAVTGQRSGGTAATNPVALALQKAEAAMAAAAVVAKLATVNEKAAADELDKAQAAEDAALVSME